MANQFYLWSRTSAGANASADPAVNWAEGQSPSSVNDSARQMMVSTAMYRDDIAGAIVTGGSSTAYTVTSYQVFDTLAHMANQMIAFTPHATNGATVTLNVDGLGAKPLRTSTGVELLAGMMIAGTPYVATYNSSDAVWYLRGFFGNPYNIPLGAGIEYWGTSAPNSSFVFPIGQAISRTTYSALFSLFGTTYGVGDGSTTFNVPDVTGRVRAIKEATATRLTNTGTGNVGIDGGTLGAVGGGAQTLLTANLPPYTPAGTISGTVTASSGNAGSGTVGGGTGVVPTSTGNLTITAAFSGTAQGGTSTPVKVAQPTIICNYILRII